jgi:hypothetical protein
MDIMFDAELWYCEPRQISNHNNELLAFMREGEKKKTTTTTTLVHFHRRGIA